MIRYKNATFLDLPIFRVDEEVNLKIEESSLSTRWIEMQRGDILYLQRIFYISENNLFVFFFSKIKKDYGGTSCRRFLSIDFMEELIKKPLDKRIIRKQKRGIEDEDEIFDKSVEVLINTEDLYINLFKKDSFREKPFLTYVSYLPPVLREILESKPLIFEEK